MSIVANRYAKALLDLAISDGAIDGYQKELLSVSQIIEAETDFRSFLHSPRNDMHTKKSVLIHVFGTSVKKNILHLLLLLLDKGRIGCLPDICLAFARMADEYRNILNITVTSARPLEKAQIDSIGEKFRSLFQAASVRVAVKTDDSLVGGVKVAVGDKLYDGTVKGKLSRMKSALAEK